MQVRSLQFGLEETKTPSCVSTGEASYSSFGPILALWDVFLHLVCLQFMRKITNQQFLWTELLPPLNKMGKKMKRAPATRRRHSKPNSPLTHFSPALQGFTAE